MVVGLAEQRRLRRSVFWSAAKQEAGRALVNLGATAAATGDHKKAIVTTSSAIALLEQSNDTPGLITALLNVASGFMKFGEYGDAERALRRAVPLLEAYSDPRLSSVRDALQDCVLKQGQ